MAYEIESDLYTIIPRSNHGAALDCRNAAKDNDLILYTRNGSDAQFIQLLYVDDWNYHEGIQTYLRFPLIGGGLSRNESMNEYDGAPCHVYLWSSAARRQRWAIRDQTFTTFEGAAVATAHIVSDSGTWMLQAPENVNDTVKIVPYNKDDTGLNSRSMWMFQKAGRIIPNNKYKIISATKPDGNLCLGVSSSSRNPGQAVTLEADDGDKSKLWTVSSYEDNGRMHIFNGDPYEELWLCYADFSSRYPIKIDIAGYDNPRGQWVVVQDGTAMRNGVEYPTYEIRAVGDNDWHVNMLVDVYNGDAVAGTRIQLFEENNSPAQRFFFLAADGTSKGGGATNNGEWDTGGNNSSTDYATWLPTPTNLTAKASCDGGEMTDYQTKFYARNKVELWPCWTTNGAWKYKIRYRYRMRTGADSAVSPYSNWMNWVVDGELGKMNDGFAQMNVPDVTTHEDGTYNGQAISTIDVPKTITISPSLPYMDLQLSIKAMDWKEEDPTYRSLGPEFTWNVQLAYQPQVSIQSCIFGAKYFRVGWKGDFPQNGSATFSIHTLMDNKPVVLGWTEYGVPGSGTTSYIPFEEATYIPPDGTYIVVDLTFRTDDGGVGTASYTGRVSYNASNGLEINETIYDNEDGSKTVRFARPAKWTNVWIIYDQGHGAEFFQSFVQEDGSHLLFPPLGTGHQYQILIQADNGDGTWASKLVDMESVPEARAFYHWDALNLHYKLLYNKDEAPDFSVSYSADMDSVEVSGRTRPVVTAGTTVSASSTVSGVIIPKETGEYEDTYAFEELIHARSTRVLFRSPEGFMAFVGITGGSIDYQRHNWFPVSISQTEWSQ